jgi:uncharacterized damage-inducible protein DinB
MTTATETDPRYPIGRFTAPQKITAEDRRNYLDELAAVPARVRRAVEGLTNKQLDTPYREGGWTVRQVVHHLADSHTNAFMRFKLALTENRPTIKPYDENAWAKLTDYTGGVDTSLAILDGVHARMVQLLRHLPDDQFATEFVHPERGPMTIDANLALYAWHGRHHTAHINGLRERMGWK